MALPHAHLLDIIDIGPLGSALRDAVSTSLIKTCLLYTSPSPRDISGSRMPSSA